MLIRVRVKNLDFLIFNFLSIFIDFRSPKGSRARPAGSDAAGGGGDADDEPTTATPHSHQQANTHRDKISRSEDTPLTLAYSCFESWMFKQQMLK